MQSLENEIWKVIPDLESYCINQYGTVKALPKIREGNLSTLRNHSDTTTKSKRHYKEHIIKPTFKANYLYVNLMHGGTKKSYRVHRLVYKAFVGEIPNDKVIDHIDGNKLNNHISNLRCVSQSENCCNENTKYNISKSVIQLDPVTHEIINEFPNMIMAALNFGKTYKKSLSTPIGKCCKGKLHSAYGFCWQYKEDWLNGVSNIKPLRTQKVVQYDLDCNYIREFATIKEAAIFNNIKSSGICSCLLNKSKTYKNYIWKYEKV